MAPVKTSGGEERKMEGIKEEVVSEEEEENKESDEGEGPPQKKIYKPQKRKYKPRTEEQRKRDNERRRLARQKMKPEEKARDNARRKRKKEELTAEEKEEWKARRRFQLYCKRMEMTDEERKAYNLKKWISKQARIAEMTEEEKQAAKRKNVENLRNYYKKLKVLKGERLEKHKKMVTECAKKNYRKRTDKLLEYFRKKTAEETPEQRKKRLRGYKINQRRRQMKKEYEREGILSGEEIERRLKEWVEIERGKPLSPVREEERLSEYKPRISGRKPKEGSWRWKELYEGKERSPSPEPPPTKQRKRRSCWKLPDVPLEQEEILVEKEGPRPLPKVGSPPPSHQIVILNPLPDRFSPGKEEQELQPPPSPPASVREDFYPDPKSPPSPSPSSPPDFHGGESPPHFQEDEHQQHSPAQTAHFVEVSSSETPCRTSIWKCPLCATPILSLFSLPSHLRLHHPLHPSTPKNIPSSSQSPTFSKFQCILCPWPTSSPPIYLRFKNSSGLLSHVYLHHPTSYHPCPLCPLLFYSSSRLSNHIRHCRKKLLPSKKSTSKSIPSKARPPPPSTRICEDCGRTFSNLRSYNFHQKNSHPTKTQGVPLLCPKCPRICVNLRAFWLHFSRCGLKIPKKRPHPSLPPKDSRYSSDGPHPCFQCSKTFIQKATLDDHIRRDHLGLTHVCPLCSKNFQSAGKVWRHQVEYHGLSPSSLPPPPRGVEATNCKYCNLLIMRGYEQHVKKKHPEDMEDFTENILPSWKAKHEKVKQVRGFGADKKIACLYCSVVLPQGSMKRHVKNFHDESEKWSCQDCGKVCKNLEKLEYHVALVHAYQGIEEILKKEQLVCDVKRVREGKRQAACKLCGLEVPLDKFSVRVHFVVSHYDVIKRLFDENGKKR